jgi:hypothetical protein
MFMVRKTKGVYEYSVGKEQNAEENFSLQLAQNQELLKNAEHETKIIKK